MIKKVLLAILVLLVARNCYGAAFTSVANGNWNDGTTWGNTSPGTEGIDYPGANDTASIGHTVTINDTRPSSGEIGAITITSGGILTFDATSNTKLSINDTLAVQSGGELRMGSISIPINAANTCELYANLSASKYLDVQSGGLFVAQGASKTYYYSMLNAAITAGDKSLTTANSTVWSVGDVILVPTTSTTQGQTEKVTITGISGTTIYIDSNGDGTGASPTFSYGHAAIDCPILNITRNVKITRNKSGSQIRLITRSDTNVDWVDIDGIGYSNQYYYGAIGGYGAGEIGSFDYCVFQEAPRNAIGAGNQTRITSCSNNIFYNNSDFGIYMVDFAWLTATFSYCFLINNDDGIYVGLRVQAAYYTEGVFDNIWAIGNTNSGVGGYGWSEFAWSDIVSHSNGGYGVRFGSGEGRFLRIKSYYNGTYGLYFDQGVVVNVEDRNSYYGSDGSNTKANSSADIRLGTSNYSPLTIKYKGQGVTLASTTKLSVRSNPQEAKHTFLGISGYGHTQGRSWSWQKRGYINDQITGGQAEAWARGGSGLCLYLDPNSISNSLEYEFWIPVTASTSTQLKFYHKITSGFNGSLKVTIYDSNDDTTKLLNEENITFTDDGNWHLYTSTSITPTHTGFCRVVLDALNGTTSGDIGIDDLILSTDCDVNFGNMDRGIYGLPLQYFTDSTAGDGGGGTISGISVMTNF